MSDELPDVAALRAALSVSPDNVPLRSHLAATLLKYGRAADAVTEYREALHQAGDDVSLKIGLAKAYDRLGKTSHAIVIAEELVRRGDPPAEGYLLYARLLLKEGDVQNAIAQYRAAIDDEPSLRDPELEERLGLDADAASDVVDGRVRAFRDEPEGESPVEIERPKVSFADVGGMDGVKDEIRMKIIHPLTHAEMFKAYGKAIGGGVLMYGPPGCGKTHLARATAGEVKANFLAVGINDVLDMWIGTSERNLHALFDQARRSAPCVLFFDEVDALGASRSDMRSSAGRHLINQFLSEMDGVNASNEGVLILAATNAPWHLDPAFRRPGRFDRILFVPPPDAKARSAIVEILLRGKPAESVDFDAVAKKSLDFSGADLKAVVDRAVESKLAEAMRTGIPAPLTTKDLVTAAKTGKPTTRDWFATARNYALYSNEGGQYDEVLEYLKIKR
ncbi:MAG: AAA family ATPase [Planctomycetaceae bacterium]